jgi:hypothetical protein
MPTTAYSAQSANHLSPGATAFVVDGLGILGLGALLVFSLIRYGLHRRRQKLAHRAMLRQGDPLHVGPSVLAGTVADDGEGDAIVIAIHQVGQEYQANKGGSWSHRWVEAQRSVEAKPFYVVRADGERVRVEPDSRVLVVDRLDPTERRGYGRRVRRAKLSPGEHVFILGDMTRAPDPKLGGYRESPEGWVLRPPRGDRMLVSTEPLEDRHRVRKRLWLSLSLVTAVIAVGWHASLFAPVHRLRWKGRPATAVAIEKHSTRQLMQGSHGSTNWDYQYWVTAAGEHDQRWLTQVEPSSYQAIEPGTPLAFRVVDGPEPLVQIGSRACAHFGDSLVGIVLAPVWLIMHLMFVFVNRPWWSRRRIVDDGAGHLSES